MSLQIPVCLVNPYHSRLQTCSCPGIVLPAGSTRQIPLFPVTQGPSHLNEEIIPFLISRPYVITTSRPISGVPITSILHYHKNSVRKIPCLPGSVLAPLSHEIRIIQRISSGITHYQLILDFMTRVARNSCIFSCSFSGLLLSSCCCHFL